MCEVYKIQGYDVQSVITDQMPTPWLSCMSHPMTAVVQTCEDLAFICYALHNPAPPQASASKPCHHCI